jgi:hypothetical protein
LIDQIVDGLFYDETDSIDELWFMHNNLLLYQSLQKAIGYSLRRRKHLIHIRYEAWTLPEFGVFQCRTLTRHWQLSLHWIVPFHTIISVDMFVLWWCPCFIVWTCICIFRLYI